MHRAKCAHYIFLILISILPLQLGGCASLVIGGGDAGSNDPRTRTEIEVDARITRQINRLYVKDASIPATDIRVTTFRGVVSLGGKVSSMQVRDTAVMIAKQVEGVRGVRVEFW